MNVLFLCHRIPYPPDKGEKIRTFHQLRTLAAKHRVDLFTLAHQDEMAGIASLSAYCDRLEVCRIRPAWARLRSLLFLFSRLPFTLPYFYSPAPAQRIQRALRLPLVRSHLHSVLLHGGTHVTHVKDIPIVMDFVDVDSDKWFQYSLSTRGPYSWIYSRESKYYRRFEQSVCGHVTRALVTTEREARLLRQVSEACPIDVVRNGVDCVFFNSPTRVLNTDPVIIFTGDMGYLPNQMAVEFFAHRVFPSIRKKVPNAHFLIVGRNPSRRVTKLREHIGIEVTGFVPDVRPFLSLARA